MLYGRLRRPRWLKILGFERRREAIGKYRGWGLGSVLFVLGLSALLLVQDEARFEEDSLAAYAHSTGRKLLSTVNETSHCAYEEEHYPEAWVFNHIMCILITFIAMAIICDDFFVPSLEIISEKLNLSEDVAGATFMAAGSSAPELFTSVAGVVQQTDVGIGTIVGSAVFNLLMIIALTTALAGKVLDLDWRPLMRDSLFYGMSLVVFIGFAWDGYFQHFEAALLLSLYILYIVLMVFNPRVVAWMGTWKNCCKKPEESPEDIPEEMNGSASRRLSLTGGHAGRISFIQRERSHSEERIFHHKRGSIAGVLICPPPKHLLHHNAHRKDSNGHYTHDNNSVFSSNETSHMDLQRQTPDSQTHLKPGSGSTRNGYGGSPPSDDIEMSAVELPAITTTGKASAQAQRHRERCSRTRRTFSEDIPSLIEEDVICEDEVLTNDSRSKLKRSTSEQTDSPIPSNRQKSPRDTNLSPPQNLDQSHSPTSSNQTCNSAQALMPEEPAASPGNVSTDMYHSDHSLQNSMFQHHYKKVQPEEIVNEEVEEVKDSDGEESEEETMNICPCCPCCPLVRTYPPSTEGIKKEGGCVNWTKFILRWIIFIPAFPFVCLFSWTIPDCSKPHLKKYYLLSFFVSVTWIAAISYAMVTVVERAGCILGIDSYVMGLVIVAIGTSIPDAMSSILVARDGYGDMAVSNAIGSNVFDINLGLGLPFLLRICIDKGAPIALLKGTEWVDFFSGKMVIVPHAKFGFILLLILFLALMVFGAVRFKLNKWIGITFVFMYVFFLIYAFMQELYCVRVLEMYC